MKVRPEEITAILRKQIERYDVETDLAEVGTVLQVGDGIARVYGIESAVAMEMLEFERGVTGLAFNLEEDNVGCALFGEWDLIKEGDSAKRTGRVASVPVGEALIGRIVDPLGNPLDGGPPIETDERLALEIKAPGVDRPPAGQGAASDRHQGDRRDDERRPRPARADHRRPLDGQDGDPRRHDPEPARPGRDLHLRRDRAEGLDRRADPRAPEGPGGHGVHDHRHGARVRGRSHQVDGALRGLRDGRVLHEQGRPLARHVRRSLEARRRLSADVAAPPAPARPRGLPR